MKAGVPVNMVAIFWPLFVWVLGQRPPQQPFLQRQMPTLQTRQLYAGDICQMPCGAVGVCRKVSQCKEVPDMIREGNTPTPCSYDNNVPVVCCPSGGKADRMCLKYSSAVYQNDNTQKYCRKKVDQCVMKNVPFIVGGSKASPHEFPHMALLGYDDRNNPSWRCGGSLISDRFVVTAAHCLFTRSGIPKIVRLGELDVTVTNDSLHEDFDVEEAITHPDHKVGVNYNDIALLRLNRPVTFTAAIRPACLHTEPEIYEKLGIVSGWGLIKWADPTNSDHLMKLNLHIYKTESCQHAYRTLATTNRLKDGIVENSMVCCGSPEGGKDTCRGDSGGPLMVKLNNPYCMYSLIGITSFGKGACGETLSPSVYTRVSYFVPWIESVVWPGDVE